MQWAGSHEKVVDKVVVDIFNTVSSLMEVDSKSQVVTVSVFARTIWTDRRLAYNKSCLPEVPQYVFFPGSPQDTLWTPSVYVSNLIDNPQFLSGVWFVSPGGEVWYSRKEKWRISCEMNFEKMPYDMTLCLVRFRTFADTFKHVELRVQANKQGMARAKEKTIGGAVDWTMEDLASGEGEPKAYEIHGSAALDMFIKIQRGPQYLVDNVIFPVVFLVAIAYFSFWLTRAAVPARVAIIIICYLSILNKQSSVLQTLPRLSGPIWLLKFMQVSISFVFVAVAEFIVANVLGRAEGRINKAKAALAYEASQPKSPPPEPNGAEVTIEVPCAASIKQQLRKKGMGRLDSLMITSDGRQWLHDEYCDVFMRYAFPIAYSVAIGALYAELGKK